ncbi:MAG: hypothetical protein HZB16_16800 [Armatimonadetes bacterium]|nr:hypothetical protein [Armatimonadota bacterium]
MDLRRLGTVLLTLAVVAGSALAADPPLRVFYLGNSVTDTVNYRAFAQCAESLGTKVLWGRQMIPGCPLFGLWRAAESRPDNCGFVEKPFGSGLNALANYEWDAVTLQPFDRLLANADPKNADEQGDILYAQKYFDLATRRSPDVQVYIYARWPRMLIGRQGVPYDKDAYDKPVEGKTADWSKVDPFEGRFTAKYTGGWDTTNETADYFETLTRTLRNINPKAKKPPLMIPVGHVLLELDRRFRAGDMPGFKGAYDLYKDAIHLTNAGSYVVGATFYATLLRRDPKGFPTEPYKVTDARFAELVQQVVWKVVSEHPLAGIATPPAIEPHW